VSWSKRKLVDQCEDPMSGVNRLDPAAVIPSLRAAVRGEDPALRVDAIDSATDLLDRTLATDCLIAMLAWAFGVLAITLAEVGIYGLLSYDVTRRTAEIGVPWLSEPAPGDVSALVMKELVMICGVGLAVGSALAGMMAKLVESLVFRLRPGDPLIQIAAAIILVIVAGGAAWLPGIAHGSSGRATKRMTARS